MTDRINFNTTLVFIYLWHRNKNSKQSGISIQHLFLFIMKMPVLMAMDFLISIQHLFLFISQDHSKMTTDLTFQYNTCFYLSRFKMRCDTFGLRFQYNTCFYLSFEFGVECVNCANFNTTLVFIYPDIISQLGGEGLFQYNTCFYLSTKLLVEGKEEEEFQYNTCFYLSFSNVWVSFSIQKFQYNTCFYLSTWWRWNLHLKMISIQHLFLFIENVKTKIQNLSKFQYNTCFYLSGQRPSFHCV